jgi:hypothetical protein
MDEILESLELLRLWPVSQMMAVLEGACDENDKRRCHLKIARIQS